MVSCKKKLFFGTTLIFAVVFLILLSYFKKVKTFDEKPIVAVITSFNNAKWVNKNLDSIFNQNYKNFRVIYLDDCSTDGTADLVEKYIQEKGVADKITLIKNKKRSIKMRNLYTIHHSINDWDIIAQIDGDDWLSHNKVFQLVNKAYCDGAWLAYTQFETSNGYKGPNELPPFWVRKAGSFRKYKPWFMFSHLKTFYAWLFKQIKLKDFLHTTQGTFQPLNDDVLMMYPMLEMARDHIAFIPQICYIFNVDPGYRPSLKGLQTNVLEEFLRCPPYQKLDHPVISNKKNYQADIVFDARNAVPSLTKELLQTMYEYFDDVDTIFILSSSTSFYSEFESQYPKISFIKNLDILNDMIQSMKSYIILLNKNSILNHKIEVNDYIQYLEQTFADCVFLNLEEVPLHENKFCEYITNTLYAQTFKKDKKLKELKNRSILCRKQDCLSFIDHEPADSNEVRDKKLVGLFFKQENQKKYDIS